MSRHVIWMAVLLVIVSLIIPVDSTTVPKRNITPKGSDVTLTLDFGNGTQAQYNNLTGINVLVLTESVVEVDAEWTANLAFVVSIAGVENDDQNGLWWQYWVNGELATIASNLFQLEDRDQVLWKYTSSQIGDQGDLTPNASVIQGGVFLGVLGLSFLVILVYLVRRSG
ncbi:MAG: DUF4430 domain-containing protein [Candidatus Hodarchaeota archaeon]